MAQPLACCVQSVYTINIDEQHEQHTVHLIVYHIIWCPKRRRKVLHGKIAERLEQSIHEVCTEREWEIIGLNRQPNDFKGRSSPLLREAFLPLLRRPSLWTRLTFYSTAGKVSADILQKDIERQSKA
ncbi:MAG: transposase [Ktedonobacteraceae bacterium]|jgi:putative transposase